MTTIPDTPDARQPARLHRRAALALAASLAAPALATAGDASSARWIASWTASPQATWGADFAFPTNLPDSLDDRTIRQFARISLGGNRVRLVLSNDYGHLPLTLAAVHVALADNAAHPSTSADILPGTDRVVTFAGHASVTLAPGASVLSDAIDLAVAPLSSLAVSIHVRGQAGPATFHWDARQTTFLAAGDQAGRRSLPGAGTTTARLFLGAIQVERSARSRAVVAIGDSITDGNGATLDRNTRWPDFLATRLAPHDVAVLNAGISGARLLSDRMGVNALARFDRDVLDQPHVAAVVVMLGINDIAWPGTAFDPQGTAPSLDALVAGYRQLVARAHARGVRIVGATLTPFEGALPDSPLSNYYDAGKDALRQQINRWIRTSGAFDEVIDFDALLRDPAHPSRLAPAFDSGDHLHPGDAGNAAMAAALASALRLDGLAR